PAGATVARRTVASSLPALLPLLRPGLSVLDVGCGPGTLTAEIARHVAPGPVVGMDASPEMVRIAEAASPPGLHANLVFYAGDVCNSQWRGRVVVVSCPPALPPGRHPPPAPPPPPPAPLPARAAPPPPPPPPPRPAHPAPP